MHDKTHTKITRPHNDTANYTTDHTTNHTGDYAADHRARWPAPVPITDRSHTAIAPLWACYARYQASTLGVCHYPTALCFPHTSTHITNRAFVPAATRRHHTAYNLRLFCGLLSRPCARRTACACAPPPCTRTPSSLGRAVVIFLLFVRKACHLSAYGALQVDVQQIVPSSRSSVS